MQATRRLWQHRQPMIRFLGKRTVPKNIDHTPHAHPESPDHSLPESFAQYRNRAIQHGPLGGQQQQTQQRSSSSSSAPAQNPQPGGSSGGGAGGETMKPYGGIGGKTGQQLGSFQPGQGEVWDREELPARFRRRKWTEAEMDAVDSGGASLFA